MNNTKIKGLIIFGMAIILTGIPSGLINGSIISSEENLKCRDCNLVIISLTNTRKDHIGMYGYKRDTTPNIDKFFKNSLVFENAFAPASWTLPVSASLYTSLFPYTHGVMDRYDGSKLSDSILTITEIFKENGYTTAGFTGGGDYNRSFNISQGFDLYVDEKNYEDFNILRNKGALPGPSAYLGVEQILPPTIDWIQKNKNNKLFLFLQGYDTHCPFIPKKPFDKKFDPDYKGNIDFSTCLWTFKQTDPMYKNDVRYWQLKTWYSNEGIKDLKMSDRDVDHMIALYDGEIVQADYYLRDFFKTVKDLGLENNTVFVFMSEHGDLFGEHGRFMRGGPLRGTFYDPVINFPLLIKHPKINKPLRIKPLVQTIDIMPTLLDIFNLKDKQKTKRQGKSLIPAITGEKEINEYIYAASKYNAKNNPFFSGLSIITAIRNKEWKLIREEIFDTNSKKMITESYELYRISEDSKEENNLYNIKKDIAGILKLKMEEWLNSKSPT
ncbi:MAG TPA: hypothetical protein DCY98_09380 [Nitrospinae bacterium]|nr:hypothetical protein [Nitrospinota bacterium]